MKHVFIVNPVSGPKDAGMARLRQLEETAAKLGLETETAITQAPHHATQIAGDYGKAGGPVRLYAVGGDGTLNEVLAGAWQYENAEVACVPCGSGNDFVRSFGTPEDFLDLEDLFAGAAVTMDLMEVDGGISAAITSTGLDAEVAYNIPKYRRIPLLGGTMAYNISIVEKLLKPLGKHLRVTIDGKTQEGRYLIATVCNGQTYGGGYRAAPYAKLDDGLLDIVLVQKVSRLRIASIIGKYKNGTHMLDGELIPQLSDVMQYYRGREVVIEPTGTEEFILNVDGECGPAERLYARVMPKVARFVLPRRLYARWVPTG